MGTGRGRDVDVTPDRLPDGFAVQLDGRVKTLRSGTALLGGSPRRLLRLSPSARRLISGAGRLEVCDSATAHLARTLLDASVAHPVCDDQAPVPGPSCHDVTVVIPVRDNDSGVRRLIAALAGMRVIVVDDGSLVPLEAPLGTDRCEILRHPVSKGPAAARNAGMARCDTDFVAFLDSDVVPRRGWLEPLLGHFRDPAVVLVAPRVVALSDDDGLLARYEAVSSALDLGPWKAPVQPYGPVPYVPSAAIVCRRSALSAIGGFDESMHAGEDVDLCWRLVDAGFRLRYEPTAHVGHDHRTRPWEWVSRRAFYGTSAAPLAVRHPDKTAALVMSRWSLLALLLPALGSWIGLVAGLVCAGKYTQGIARSFRAVADGPGPAEVVSLVAGGLSAAATQLASAICRTYWPVVLSAAAVSRRCRRVALAAAVLDGMHSWATQRREADAMGPLAHAAVNCLADLAYGAGVWAGMVRQRTFRPLHADIRP